MLCGRFASHSHKDRSQPSGEDQGLETSTPGAQACDLGVPRPTAKSECLGLTPVSAPNSSFLLIQTLADYTNGSSHWCNLLQAAEE